MTTHIKKLEADYFRSINTAAVLKQGHPMWEFHNREAERLKQQLDRLNSPKPRPRRQRPRFHLMLAGEGFMDGQMLLQPLPLSPALVALLEELIGINAIGVGLGQFKKLMSEARHLTDKEQDLIAEGIEVLKQQNKPTTNLHLVEDVSDDKRKQSAE